MGVRRSRWVEEIGATEPEAVVGRLEWPSPGIRVDHRVDDGGLTVDLRPSAVASAVAMPLPSPTTGLLGAPGWQLWVKRGVDILGAVVLLLLLSPVFLVTALAIALTSPGPVFFTQERAGKDGRPFRCAKFRSMTIGADGDRHLVIDLNEMTGPVFKIKDDPRVTPVGKIIRKLSIDELPQLWHVLTGHMSLVGPRPLPVEESAALGDWERQRLLTKPGMTCIWQVSGRSDIDFPTWMSMDVDYIRNWSLMLDVVLVARTVPAVIKGRGAY